MRTQENAGRFHQRFSIQLGRYPPSKSFADRVSYRLAEQPIAIRSRKCIEPRMKIITHDSGILHRHICWKFRIQRTHEIRVGVGPVYANRGNLPRRVNAGICSAGEEDRSSFPSDYVQGFFQFTLYGSSLRLTLTSVEIRAIVSKSQLVTCHIGWWRAVYRSLPAFNRQQQTIILPPVPKLPFQLNHPCEVPVSTCGYIHRCDSQSEERSHRTIA